MHSCDSKKQGNKDPSVAKEVSQGQNGDSATFQFLDKRPCTDTQTKIQGLANNSPQTRQAGQLQCAANKRASQASLIQKKANNTGLPDGLKSGIENLSGYSMDDVKVHYNSSEPRQLQAHAYAKGTDIHLASGQEQHLPHEAWHVVQQKQGRVQATKQMKGRAQINDDECLEKEADIMGKKALQPDVDASPSRSSLLKPASLQTQAIQRKLGFEFEIHVNTDTEGDDEDPLVTVRKQDELDSLLGLPGEKLFDVHNDNSRSNMVVNKSDFTKLDSTVRNRKILEIVTAPIDEFNHGARDQLASQMDTLVTFGTAIRTATTNLTKPVSLQSICTEFLRVMDDERYQVAQKDDVMIGRDQAALEQEGIKKSVQTKVQSLSAMTHYTVGVDIERLPEYVDALTKNPELSNKKRDGTRQKTILTSAKNKVDQLMVDESITSVDIEGVEGQVKGFFLSVIINLLFGKIDQGGLDKNFAPILSRTDGVKLLNAIDAQKNGVKHALKGNWTAIRSKIIALTGTTGGNYVMDGDSDFPTVTTYLNNLVNATKDGFTQAFGGMKELGPEDVGEQFLFDDREKGIIYENRAMKSQIGGSTRYDITEWKAFALRVFDEVKAINTKDTDKF